MKGGVETWNGWTDEKRKDGSVVGLSNGWEVGWIGGWVDGWMDGWIGFPDLQHYDSASNSQIPL